MSEVFNNVKDYYGKVLQSTEDLKSQVCKTPSRSVSSYVCKAIGEVHPEVAAKYYGCGLCIPAGVQGARILDLGSGSGRDCFALSKLVGETGEVVGVDMTKEQVDIANKYVEYHTAKFGYDTPNVRFVEGFVEELSGAAGLKSDYFDIIVSNCVVNLCPDKRAVLSEAYKVLKPGGELYFSDMYTDTQQSEVVRNDSVLWGEGFGGALHWKQLHEIAKEVGFSRPYLVSCSPIKIEREDFKAVLGSAMYCSATYRLFKTTSTNHSNGSVTYKGNIPGHTDSYTFDHKLSLPAGSAVNTTADIITALTSSRLRDEFEFHQESAAEDPFEVIKRKVACGEKVDACRKIKGINGY